MWGAGCRCVRRGAEDHPVPMGLPAIAANRFCMEVFKQADHKVMRPDFDKDPAGNMVGGDKMVQDIEARLSETDLGLCEATLRDDKKFHELLQGAGPALQAVCTQECGEIIKMVKKEAFRMIRYWSPDFSFSDACNHFVVKRVESHLLGCCADSCGWNGMTCTRWPFIRMLRGGQHCAWLRARTDVPGCSHSEAGTEIPRP